MSLQNFNSNLVLTNGDYAIKSEPEDQASNVLVIKQDMINVYNDRSGSFDEQMFNIKEEDREVLTSVNRECMDNVCGDGDIKIDIHETNIKTECFHYEVNQSSDNFNRTYVKKDSDIKERPGACYSSQQIENIQASEQVFIEVAKNVTDKDLVIKQETDPLSPQEPQTLTGDKQLCDIKTVIQTPNGDRLYKCDVCNKRFTRSTHLTGHKRTHTGDKPYECDVCHKRFIQFGILARHKRIHTGDKPYECDVCHKRFIQLCILTRHKQVHTGVRPYECDVCNQSFCRQSTLQIHKRVHTGEKSHECDVCYKKFTNRTNLQNHKRIHTGEKPYVCDVCNKGFTTVYSLKCHKPLHIDGKPYECDVCNIGFKRKSYLTVHRRIHTGERPYKCDICTKTFTKLIHLNTHKLIHTAERHHYDV